MDSEDKGRPIVVLIDNLKQLADGVEDKDCESMERICRLAKGMNVMIIAAGRSDDITKYNMELLTSGFIKHQNGMSLSGSPNQNNFFASALNNSEKSKEPEKGIGIVYNNEITTFIKVMR